MEEENVVIKEKKKIQISLGLAISLIIVFILIIAGVIVGAVLISKDNKIVKKEQNKVMIEADEDAIKGNFNTYYIENGKAYFAKNDDLNNVKEVRGLTGTVKRIEKMTLDSDMTYTIFFIMEDGQVYELEENENADTAKVSKRCQDYKVDRIIDKVDVTGENPMPIYELKLMLIDGTEIVTNYWKKDNIVKKEEQLINEEDEEKQREEKDKKQDNLVEQAKEIQKQTQQAIEYEENLDAAAHEFEESNTQEEVQEGVIRFDQHYVKSLNISYPSNWVISDNGYAAKITSIDNQESSVTVSQEEYTEDDLAYFENWYSEGATVSRKIINGQEWSFLYFQDESANIIMMLTVKNNWLYQVGITIKDGVNEEIINQMINSITIPEG